MRIPSNLKTEALAGLTTFFTLSYIVVVNPAILSTEGTGMPYSGVLTATVLLGFSMSLLMGLYAKLPFAVAPGMGINAFFTYSLVLGKKIPWQTALGITFWAGILFLILSILPVRRKIAEAIPGHLRHAAAGGIGIFLTFIGMKNLGLVVKSDATLVRLGTLDLKILIALASLLPVFLLFKRKNPLAFLSGIAFVTVVYLAAGWTRLPESFFAAPDFGSVLFKLDIWGALQLSLVPAILAILFTDLFDSISTFVGVSQAAGMLDQKGEPKNLSQGLLVDSVATLGAGLLGTSSGTAYIESAAGIEAGGRTGLTAVFTGLCFLPCLFIAPLAGMIPAQATAPILIFVGALMFGGSLGRRLEKMEDLLPAYLTLVLIPLTFSITQGMLWGFLSHTLLYALAGRRRELTPAMVAISAISVGLLWMEHHG